MTEIALDVREVTFTRHTDKEAGWMSDIDNIVDGIVRPAIDSGQKSLATRTDDLENAQRDLEKLLNTSEEN